MSEKWKSEHEKLYGDLGSTPPPAKKKRRKKIPDGTFPLIQVTQSAHDLVRDLEQAYARMGAAKTPEEIDAAFQNLCHRRRDLYQHIEAAEQHTAWNRVTNLRFD